MEHLDKPLSSCLCLYPEMQMGFAQEKEAIGTEVNQINLSTTWRTPEVC